MNKIYDLIFWLATLFIIILSVFTGFRVNKTEKDLELIKEKMLKIESGLNDIEYDNIPFCGDCLVRKRNYWVNNCNYSCLIDELK